MAGQAYHGKHDRLDLRQLANANDAFPSPGWEESAFAFACFDRFNV
jgi:hypothetical protein